MARAETFAPFVAARIEIVFVVGGFLVDRQRSAAARSTAAGNSYATSGIVPCRRFRHLDHRVEHRFIRSVRFDDGLRGFLLTNLRTQRFERVVFFA